MAYSPARPMYTSGRIDSHDKKIFTYGYFECRMITPVGQVSGPGLWSAVWLLGNSMYHGVAWPTCGEMELYEQRPSDAIVRRGELPQPVPATIGDNEFIACCHYGDQRRPSYHSSSTTIQRACAMGIINMVFFGIQHMWNITSMTHCTGARISQS